MAQASWLRTEIVPVDVDLDENTSRKSFASMFEATRFNDTNFEQANIVPTMDDSYRNDATHDYRVPGGMGVFRLPKEDAVDKASYMEEGHTKLMGRSTVTADPDRGQYQRHAETLMNRMDGVGLRNHEVPDGTRIPEWAWNSQRYEENGYNVNSVVPRPDSDLVYRRIHEPAPSRRVKMLGTDIEEAGYMPQNMTMAPLHYVEMDESRHPIRAIGKNADVRDKYHHFDNVRGLSSQNGAPVVWSRAAYSNPKGRPDKSVPGWIPRPQLEGECGYYETGSDNLYAAKVASRYIRGNDLDYEMAFHNEQMSKPSMRTATPFAA